MKYIFLIGIIFLISSCSKKPSEVFYQVSCDSTMVIYKYQFKNTSSSFPSSGFKLAKFGQDFDLSLPDYPIDYLYKWADSFTPIGIIVDYPGFDSELNRNISGFKVDFQILQNPTITTSEYYFKNVSTHNGYLELTELKLISGIAREQRSLFPKGSMQINNDELGNITSIEAHGYGLEPGYFSQYIFHPKDSIHVSDVKLQGIFKKVGW